MFFRGKEIPISESDYVSVAMPPVIDKPFGEMTKKEALSIFAWFMENLDARIHNMCVYLQEIVCTMKIHCKFFPHRIVKIIAPFSLHNILTKLLVVRPVSETYTNCYTTIKRAIQNITTSSANYTHTS